MRRISYIVVGLFAIAALSACTTLSEPLDPDFGQAVRAANAKQIVSTEAARGAPVMDPQMKAAAYQRYLEDKVKKPKSSDPVSGKR